MVARKRQSEDGVVAGASAEMIEYMRRDFLDTTGEKLAELDDAISTATDLDVLRLLAFEIKGQARNYGMTILGLVAARFEDYLNALDHIAEWTVPAIRAFMDTMHTAIEGGYAEDADPGLIVRGLPARPRMLGIDDNAILDFEVMLVMQHNSQTTYVEREMQACGYRTVVTTSPFEAFEQVVRTRPDLVIVSAVMPGLSGIDLATALATMPETRNTPVAVLTSLDDDDENLALLPKSVPVIRKGDSFGDDLAKAMSHHFLL